MNGDGCARILVVDDVPENVRLLGAVLTPRGYEVISATDGSVKQNVVELALNGNPLDSTGACSPMPFAGLVSTVSGLAVPGVPYPSAVTGLK